MKSEKEIERIIKAFCITADSHMDTTICSAVSEVMRRNKQTKAGLTQQNIWRAIMRSPLTKLAVAASVVVAGVIGLSLWTGTQSGIALADVLAQVEKARSVRWNLSGVMSGDASGRPFSREERATFLFSRDWGQTVIRERTDPNGGQTPLTEFYSPLQKKIIIDIDHRSKRYTRTELDDATSRRGQEVLSQATDPGRWLKMIMNCKYESMGRSIVDGVEVEGFRTTDPNIGGFPGIIKPQVDEKVWVDVKTRLPLRLEQNGSGVAKTGGRLSIHGVLDHIQWDLPLTGAEFEPPAVPNGYVIVSDTLPGPITEEGTIQGLKQCVEWLGKYPGSINVPPPKGIQSELDGSDSPAAVQLKEQLKGLTEQDRINTLMDAGTPLRCVNRFFTGLIVDKKDPAYYGKTVTPKDADRVLMRWKLSDSQYRVIFGDLRAETVSPERLAEIEAALAK